MSPNLIMLYYFVFRKKKDTKEFIHKLEFSSKEKLLCEYPNIVWERDFKGEYRDFHKKFYCCPHKEELDKFIEITNGSNEIVKEADLYSPFGHYKNKWYLEK